MPASIFGSLNSAPRIVLSTAYQAENTTIGTTIGTLSVANASTGSSGWTFAKTVDVNSAFTLTTATVSNAIVFNYETATSYSATYTATKVGDPASPITTQITVQVTNAFEAASLSALTGTFSLAEDAAANAVAGAISGKTSGSTLSLVDDAGGRVALSGTNIVRGATALDYETATSHSFTVRETLADSANSPRDTALSLTVTNVSVTLSALTGTFSLATGATAGTVAGALSGKTSGSTLTLTDDAGGRVALSGTNIIAGLGSITAGTYSFTVRETHAEGTNSPRDTTLSLTISDVSVIIVPLTGQSNMAGRCGPPSDGLDAGATDVYEWNCTNIDANYHTIQPVGSILHYINDGNADLLNLDGPGITILNKIKTDNPSAKVVGVPVAYGAAALAIGTTTWNSSPTPTAGGPHFEEAVTETLAAITAAKARWPGCTILIDTMFVQGEQDYANANSASMSASATYSAYYAGLASFIADWRSRITGTSVSHGKFAIGSIVPSTWQISSGTYSALPAAVNKAHVYASLNIANVTYSPGPASLDSLHYQPASAARGLGLRMASTFSDGSGPSVTTSTTQGGNVGTTTPILLTHDDPVGHATFHFAGGTHDSLFAITDAYVNGTTAPQVVPVDNTMAVGTYTFKVKARDGAGNYGPDRTITFTQATPSVTKSVNYGSVFLTGSGFGTSSGVTSTVNIKAGLNIFFYAYPSDSAQGSFFTATVNGNACTNLGYVGGGTLVAMGYESAVDITGATVVAHWGAITASFLMRHIWLTGYSMSGVTSNGHAWGSSSGAPHTSPSLTVPAGGVAVCEFVSANNFGSAVSGTLVGEDNATGWFPDATMSRDTTGTLSINGGGSYGAELALIFAALP